MIKVVVVDDERQSLNLLYNMLTNNSEYVTVVGAAKDVSSGIEFLKKEQAALVLLDIEMSDSTGLDDLKIPDNYGSSVIFVTGFDQYAVKAIKYAAMACLLKPVGLEELRIALQKLKEDNLHVNGQSNGQPIYFEKNNGQQLKNIVLPSCDAHVVVELHNIVRIEAKGSYVRIYLQNQKSHIVATSLSYYEGILPADNFFRIHKSHLININEVKQFTTGRSSKVVLKDGTELNIAARRKAAFRQIIKELNQA